MLKDSLRLLAVAAAAVGAACGGSPTRPTSPPVQRPVTLALACPADLRVTSPDGGPTPVTFAPEPSGGQSPVIVTCDPASSSPFAVGTTPVACTASDAAGQSASCTFAVDVLAPPRLQYTRFMAFGDSITEGETGSAGSFRIVDSSAAYPTRLQQMLAAHYTAQTVTVVNAGMGGQWAQYDLGRLQQALAAWRPDVVLLSEGSNDLNNGSEYIVPAANAMEDMTRAILASGAVAVVGTIPPMRPGLKRAGCPECVVPYNLRVVSLTSGKGAKIVDVYARIAPEIDLLIGPDGLHPTAAGYEVIAQAYFKAITGWFEVHAAQH